MQYIVIIGAIAFIIWLYGSTAMDIWRLLFKRKKQITAPLERLSSAAEKVKKADDSGDFEIFCQTLREASDDALCECLFHHSLEQAEAYYAERPETPLSNLLIGLLFEKRAFDARGTAIVDYTSNDQFNSAAEYASKAQEHLHFALGEGEQQQEGNEGNKGLTDKQQLAGLKSLLNLGRLIGNKLGVTESYHQAVALNSSRLDIHVNMLTVLSERWLGDEGELFEFVHSKCEAAQANSRLKHALIVVAHIETWVECEGKQQDHYFKNKAVKADVKAAYQALSMDAQSGWEAIYNQELAQNCLAFCFVMMNDRKSAGKVFGLIENKPTQYPWHYLSNDVLDVFSMFRNKV